MIKAQFFSNLTPYYLLLKTEGRLSISQALLFLETTEYKGIKSRRLSNKISQRKYASHTTRNYFTLCSRFSIQEHAVYNYASKFDQYSLQPIHFIKLDKNERGSRWNFGWSTETMAFAQKNTILSDEGRHEVFLQLWSGLLVVGVSDTISEKKLLLIKNSKKTSTLSWHGQLRTSSPYSLLHDWKHSTSPGWQTEIHTTYLSAAISSQIL